VQQPTFDHDRRLQDWPTSKQLLDEEPTMHPISSSQAPNERGTSGNLILAERSGCGS
jgi:hypothetical protein